MDNKSKKELQTTYKERDIVGGVYVIRNTVDNKLLLDIAMDLQGCKNRFEFAQKTDSCVNMKLQEDWKVHGGGQFIFEVLEELRKGETQTQKEFKADLDILKEIWLEKLSSENLY